LFLEWGGGHGVAEGQRLHAGGDRTHNHQITLDIRPAAGIIAKNAPISF
jgi:hypothetical protein